MDVALFVPCYVDQLSPDVALATLEVLERAGCRVRYDSAQTCCGQMLLSAGAAADAAQLARAHLERFRGAEAIVCPSASCTATVRVRYPRLLRELDPDAARLCEQTYELGEFLVRRLGRHSLGARFPHRVALLQTCHGLRELGLGQPGERVAAPRPAEVLPAEMPAASAALGSTELLLRNVEGLELVWPERPDECCGFGGIFSVDFPELSARIGSDRLARLARAGADYVTASDSSCLLHLDGIRRRLGTGPQSIHLAQILAAGSA
jgi:L-lactate dehydrogenase complex protein LldE